MALLWSYGLYNTGVVVVIWAVKRWRCSGHVDCKTVVLSTVHVMVVWKEALIATIKYWNTWSCKPESERVTRYDVHTGQ